MPEDKLTTKERFQMYVLTNKENLNEQLKKKEHRSYSGFLSNCMEFCIK